MPHSPERNMPLRVLVGALGLLACVSATAQSNTAEALERQTDEAFRQVFQQPQDLTGWSKYAQLLVQAGNYEGGVAALERLLLDPQAPPEVRVDVGVLYYRMGSYAMAESMLRDAVADARLQGSNRSLAESLLADTLKRNKRNQFSGALTLGVRHQTNPTYQTDDAQVLSAGALVAVANADKPSADQDLAVGVRLNHFYDLESQNSAAIVSSFGAYVVDYSSSSGDPVAGVSKPYDLQMLDLNTGLQFKPLPTQAPGLTLRPYILLANLVTQGRQYLTNQGYGLDLNWQPQEKTLYQFTLDDQRREFANRADIANADQQNGHLYGFVARVSQDLGAGQLIIGEYAMRRNRAERNIHDSDSNEIRVTYSTSYASPLSKGEYWTTAFWIGALERSYSVPNPGVSPTETRKDNEWRIGVNNTVSLAPLWSLVLAAEHSRNQANLPNYRYQNTMLSGTVIRSF